MSELQAALLAIGLGVIVAVYAFGWWQQKRYREKFATTFKASHADALYHNDLTVPAELAAFPELVGNADTFSDEASDESVTVDPCEQLNERCDFIIDLHLLEPAPAAVLVGLWQRKFDFRKPVQVCGLPINSLEWERAVSESQTLYQSFRIALQMIDRSGVISAAKLADFRDLVQGVAKKINAKASVPDSELTHRRATELDEFCASVDQMVGVNLLPLGDRLIRAIDISRAAAMYGMTLESDGAFHLLDEHGHTQFSLINQDAVPFQHHTLETFGTAGITLLLDVPRVQYPIRCFEQMMDVVRNLAKILKLNIVDDHRVALADSGMDATRAQIAGVEASMQSNGIIPGSAQARRLFS